MNAFYIGAPIRFNQTTQAPWITMNRRFFLKMAAGCLLHAGFGSVAGAHRFVFPGRRPRWGNSTGPDGDRQAAGPGTDERHRSCKGIVYPTQTQYAEGQVST